LQECDAAANATALALIPGRLRPVMRESHHISFGFRDFPLGVHRHRIVLCRSRGVADRSLRRL